MTTALIPGKDLDAAPQQWNIPHVLERIPADIHQVVLVDGCSADDTVAVARRLRPDGFEIETLIHMRVAKAGLRVAEVPSFEHDRIHGVSNLNAPGTARASSGPLAKRARSRRPQRERYLPAQAWVAAQQALSQEESVR